MLAQQRWRDRPLVVAAAVEVIGGRPGRHARIGERRLATPTAFLILLTVST